MYIGIDLGGTNIAAGVVNEAGYIIYKSSVSTLAKRPIDEIVEDMANLCVDIVDDANCSIADIEAVGVGCPGTVDSKSGTVAYSCNLKMKNTKLRAMLEKKLGKPVNLENDANAAALGEYTVNGDNADSFVLITLGTGVGGGVIIDGKPYRGFNCAGGELGHIIINADGEEQCFCGNKGCWEAYASVTALIRRTKQAMQSDSSSMMHKWVQENGEVSGRTAFDCAKMGDKTAKVVVEQYIRYVSYGLISILNIFQPSKILIGGGISKEGDYLLNPLREYVYAGDYNKYREKTKIEAATLFNDAGIIGAALSAQIY
ncbi:MAG: ROK family protein [Clostridia bacterium]|nr:ROK family protein [Clostridia bacterium]